MILLMEEILNQFLDSCKTSIYRALCIPGGAGFLPSTAAWPAKLQIQKVIAEQSSHDFFDVGLKDKVGFATITISNLLHNIYLLTFIGLMVSLVAIVSFLFSSFLPAALVSQKTRAQEPSTKKSPYWTYGVQTSASFWHGKMFHVLDFTSKNANQLPGKSKKISINPLFFKGLTVDIKLAAIQVF